MKDENFTIEAGESLLKKNSLGGVGQLPHQCPVQAGPRHSRSVT